MRLDTPPGYLPRGKTMVKRFKSGSVEEYIQYLPDLEDARGPFRNMMMTLKEEFGEHQLRTGHHPRVAKLRCEIVQIFADYLAWETDVDVANSRVAGLRSSLPRDSRGSH
jgi:hypothetical protein